MLDNFSPQDLKKAIDLIDGRYETEASGGITEDNIVDYARSGVDFISIGALTHRIKSLDISLLADFETAAS
jgi:nicotinate-nucleotide pyrophosphorylase (carboxylating)